MAHPKRILLPIDDKEHCMRAFDCKYITAAEYSAVAFNTVILRVFPKLESVQRFHSNLKAPKRQFKSKNFNVRETSRLFSSDKNGKRCIIIAIIFAVKEIIATKLFKFCGLLAFFARW